MKRRSSGLSAVLLLLPFLAFHALANAVTLVDEGKPRATIVVAQDAGELTRLAATELSKYIEQLSGTKLVQSTSFPGQGESGETAIVVGPAETDPLLREMAQAGLVNAAGLKKEGFVLKTVTWKSRPTVVVAGADDAGALYGAYELLERLGITFRLTGDIVPEKKPRLEVPELDARMEPAMTRRGFLHPVNFDNASAFSYSDYEHLLDQMARMKCNYLQFWWFAYAPWVQFTYQGETNAVGDVSAKESGYHSWTYGGFGSRTIQDVTVGREHFKDRPRLAPLEMQHVENPEQAFQISQDLLRRVIAHAAKRNIKVWLAIELAALPPNLARHAETLPEAPFNVLFGTFVHPLDPVTRDIEASQLKALISTYPGAEGIFLNFAELYPDLYNDKHRQFFEKERPRFDDLRTLSIPWISGLATLYDVNVDRLVDSNIGYFDLFSYLLKVRDEVSPSTKVGLMTVGRGYALPLFNKMLPPEVPFATLESKGVWTMMGVPMEYFAGMGDRERILQPRVDDDFDMLGMQFSVRQYAQKDRIFVDGIKNGLTGFAGQVERARGTEFNSSYLAEAAWHPALTPEDFYRGCADRMFGKGAADEMFQAFMKLEENQAYMGYYGFDGGYGVLPCCGAIREVRAVYMYSRQKNPYGGPALESWKNHVRAADQFILHREKAVCLLNEALAHLQAAMSNVAPRGRYELAYMINRTEAFRDFLAALNTVRRGYVAFDDSFRLRKQDKLNPEQFVAQLETALETVGDGEKQMQEAARKYSEIVDHVSDLAVLYHINARLLMGMDLSRRFLEDVVNYHRGKPYLSRVPFDRLFDRRPDEAVDLEPEHEPNQ